MFYTVFIQSFLMNASSVSFCLIDQFSGMVNNTLLEEGVVPGQQRAL
jgi:hypothetical protein